MCENHFHFYRTVLLRRSQMSKFRELILEQ